MYNIWRSVISGQELIAPTDWLPKYDGWAIIGSTDDLEGFMEEYLKRG